MVTAGAKRKQITISDSESDSESVSVSEDDEDYEDEFLSGSSDDGEEADVSDVEDSGRERKLTDEGDMFNKVVDLLQRRKDLQSLKLDECKAYLRKYQLRMSGTKAICIQRILEHWRIKDGNGEELYTKSSFNINCTGDVCKGDVILFKQRVYEKFNVVKRGGGGNIIGKRVVAGRVVKESYGAAKQQHTFTVEILWSKGSKPLPPLYPLLVKGRNLYRLKTFRQPWTDETERYKVLSEKHDRGAMARHVRAIAKSRTRNGASKKHTSSKKPSETQRKTGFPSKKKKRNPTNDVRAPSSHLSKSKLAETSNSERSNYRKNEIHVQPVSSTTHHERTSTAYQQHINFHDGIPIQSRSSGVYPERSNYYGNNINGHHFYNQTALERIAIPVLHTPERVMFQHYGGDRYVNPHPALIYPSRRDARFEHGGPTLHAPEKEMFQHHVGHTYVNPNPALIYPLRQDSRFKHVGPSRMYHGWRGP